MTPPLFSIIGFVSVALWALIPVLWILHKIKRPRGWFCHIALILGIAAFACAKINSKTYVNRIQLDRSDEIAAAQQRQEEARQKALESREGDVAEVRFAEDSAGDRFDEAGMDDAEKKYYDSLRGDAEPAWKKDKKERGEKGPDDSLDGLVGANDSEKGGMDTEAVEKASEPEPIIMKEARLAMANRLDGANLTIIRMLLWLSLIVVLYDYLSRFNVYEEAYFPLPIPASWARATTPLPVIQEAPQGQKTPIASELKRITRRGDSFLYLTHNPKDESGIQDAYARLPVGKQTVEVLHANDPASPIDDDFIFESLWHNRSCVVVDDEVRAQRTFERVIELFDERKSTRAQLRQPVHVIWNLSKPPTESQQRAFARAARKAGATLFIV